MAQSDWFFRSALTGLVALGFVSYSLASPAVDSSIAANSKERPFVRAEEGEVSVAVEGVSLAEILTEISAQTGIVLVLHGSPQEKISAQFQSIPLDEALHRLIKSNFVLLYSSGTEKPEVEIWVVSSGSSAPQTPLPSFPPAIEELVPRIPSEARVSLERLLQNLPRGNAQQRRETVWMLGDFKDKSAVAALKRALARDEDPDVRRRAAWVLEQLGDPQAIDALGVAVSRDSDESVRQTAVEALAKLGGQEAIEPLRSVLREDPDPFVRYEALTNLAEIAGDGVKDILRHASEDADELVRDKARELLKTRDADSR